MGFGHSDITPTANRLMLREHGLNRGRRNQPLTESRRLDDTESDVIALIQGEVANANNSLRENLASCGDRGRLLGLENLVQEIRNFAPLQFQEAALQGANTMHALRDQTNDRAEELRDFKAMHNLRRTPDYPSASQLYWYVGVICVLFLLEVVGNSYFLAKGSDFGLVGGFMEATLIAAVNIGISLYAGYWGVRECWHLNLRRKIRGYAVIAIWFAFTISFNLLVGHYRESAESTVLEGGGARAVESFSNNPLGLEEFQSFVLVAIGVLFAFIALIDGLLMDDFYPGYGNKDRRVKKSEAEFLAARADIISRLDEIREETVDTRATQRERLNGCVAENDQILNTRTEAIRGHGERIRFLEDAGNHLLSAYREANCETRKTPAPKRFREDWKVTAANVEDGWRAMEPDVVRDANTLLDERLESIVAEYEQAVEQINNVHIY